MSAKPKTKVASGSVPPDAREPAHGPEVGAGPAPAASALTVDEILAAKKARQLAVDVQLDEDGTTARFVFKAIGRKAWSALLAEHPAPVGQPAPRWNLDSFPPVALSACCVEPKMTVDEARELWDDPRWNSGEVDKLFAATLLVNSIDAWVQFTTHKASV